MVITVWIAKNNQNIGAPLSLKETNARTELINRLMAATTAPIKK
jgi:hypothetical protein